MTEVDSSSRYKVGKLIERYSLEGMARELETRWTGTDGDSESLRDLARYFNKELLRTALAETDQSDHGRDIETIYNKLTDDAVSRGERTRTEKRLAQLGVDVETLTEDFVTHQAIHTFLRNGRNVTKDTTNEDQLQTGRQTINRLQSRLVAVSETTLSRLRDAEIITLGSFKILVNITVQCTDCGTHMNISELLSNGGCDCKESG